MCSSLSSITAFLDMNVPWVSIGLEQFHTITRKRGFFQFYHNDFTYGTSQKKVSVQRAFFQLRTGIVRICERAFLDYATGTRTGMYVVNMDRANVSKLATEDVLTACAFFLR